MPTESTSVKRPPVRHFNLPNQLTTLRILFSVVLFCFMIEGYYTTSLVFFILGAGTDWLDGYFARKYGMVTTLGRILDPFADKVIICGTFILLAAIPTMNEVAWGLRPWMVVVVVARELLVTTLRSFIEERGGDFSAKWSGKIKMALQCVAAGACLLYLTFPADKAPDWLTLTLVGSVWAAVVSTLYSGAVYIVAAIKQLKD